MRYVGAKSDSAEIAAAYDAIIDFGTKYNERIEFLKRQQEALDGEREAIWNNLWKALQSAGSIPPAFKRDNYSMLFGDDEQILIRKREENPMGILGEIFGQ